MIASGLTRTSISSLGLGPGICTKVPSMQSLALQVLSPQAWSPLPRHGVMHDVATCSRLWAVRVTRVVGAGMVGRCNLFWSVLFLEGPEDRTCHCFGLGWTSTNSTREIVGRSQNMSRHLARHSRTLGRAPPLKPLVAALLRNHARERVCGSRGVRPRRTATIIPSSASLRRTSVHRGCRRGRLITT